MEPKSKLYIQIPKIGDAIQKFVDVKVDAIKKGIVLDKKYRKILANEASTSYQLLVRKYGRPSARRDFHKTCHKIYFDQTLSVDEQNYLAQQAQIPNELLQFLVKFPINYYDFNF